MVAYPDIVELRDFYASPLGRVASRLLSEKLARMTNPTPEGRALAFGFALPVIQQTEAVFLAAMPAAQGVCRWPQTESNRAVLVEEDNLPFANNSFSYVLMMHGLEYAPQPHLLLRELWRVLVPGGRLLCVVANRRGLWARRDNTPFGWGQPYSGSQLRDILRANSFVIEAMERALYVPPFKNALLLRAADMCERWGERSLHRFGGVLVVEASKQLFAPLIAVRKAKTRPIGLSLPAGA